VFWDNSIQGWSDEGCLLVDQVGVNLICKCNHLTDYVAQFSDVGHNILATVDYFNEITVQDLADAFPALICLGMICMCFVFGMVHACHVHSREMALKEHKEFMNPNTTVLFQSALQEENVARYLIRKTALIDVHSQETLLTHKELHAALQNRNPGPSCWVDESGVATSDSSEREEGIRDLFKVLSSTENRCLLRVLSNPSLLSMLSAATEVSNESASDGGTTILSDVIISDSVLSDIVVTACMDDDDEVVSPSVESPRATFESSRARENEEIFLSATDMFQFIRIMNPRFSVKQVTELLALFTFTKTDDHEIGLISEDEFLSFFKKCTAGLKIGRFRQNLEFWMQVKDVAVKMKELAGKNTRMSDVLDKQAMRWYRTEQKLDIRSPTTAPPMFEPERDTEKVADTEDDVLVAKALVDRGLEQIAGTRDVKNNFVMGLKKNHPILNLFTAHTDLERHQQIMVLFVDMLSALFVEAILFDFASGGARGGIGAVDSATNAATGSQMSGIDAQIEAYIVFGIMGGVVASIVSSIVISLFGTAQRKASQRERFEDLARRAATMVDDLSVSTPVPRLRYEVFTAHSRLSLARRHYTEYALWERKYKRTPLPREVLLGIFELGAEDVENLLKEAVQAQAAEDENLVNTATEAATRERVPLWLARRTMRAHLDREHQQEDFFYHLDQLPDFERHLFLQNVESYQKMGPIQGYVFWNIIMDDEDKFSVIQEHFRGKAVYLTTAWAVSVLWCVWCLFFVSTWLFQADNSEDVGFEPKDWVKAFGVSSCFEFLVFTPIIILVRIVLVPLIFVACWQPNVSASYDLVGRSSSVLVKTKSTLVKAKSSKLNVPAEVEMSSRVSRSSRLSQLRSSSVTRSSSATPQRLSVPTFRTSQRLSARTLAGTRLSQSIQTSSPTFTMRNSTFFV